MKVFDIVRHSVAILFCFITIIVALAAMGTTYYGYTPYSYYGGDAYTGIQNAAADTANNIAGAANDIMTILSWVTLVVFTMLMLKNISSLIGDVKELSDQLKLERQKKEEEMRRMAEQMAQMHQSPGAAFYNFQ